MAQTMTFLLSHDAKAGRVQRINGYAAVGQVKPSHVVHVETSSHEFIELDADDANHAKRLVEAWIKTMGKLTARYHFVKTDGTLALGSRIYDFRDFQD